MRINDLFAIDEHRIGEVTEPDTRPSGVRATKSRLPGSTCDAT
jgi:hypothetical protein